ncbi:C5a anaphylatoxin chemotactic receptor 1-like [Polypterus senegalus]|uniref:C5a anaphylatoxin chemotactic receptor 1-like n=1 Tax=Polypterus senegalus TaxID=55291 RepID=UPI001963AF9B|nr:C5a anaphylatoxin chemotactic receptor 1-like [Polypterus senegalus]
MEETYDLSSILNETFTDWNSTYWISTYWFGDSHKELHAHHVIYVLLYALIITLGIPGNIVVILLTGFKMKRSVSSVWFLNLACADLLCCLSIPFQIYTIIHDQHWPFGLYLCKAVFGFIFVNMFCSVLLLVVISLDCFLLVAKPVWCQNHRNTLRAFLLCLLVWVLSVLLALPLFIHFKEYEHPHSDIISCVSDFGENKVTYLVIIIYQSLMGYLFPFGTIIIFHFFIFLRVSNKVQVFGNRSSKTVLVGCAVIASFFICWLPYHIVNFLIAFIDFSYPWQSILPNIDLFVVTLAYFNSCIKPFLYVCMGQAFKEPRYKPLESVMENFMTDEVPSQSVVTFTTNSSSICDQSAHI